MAFSSLGAAATSGSGVDFRLLGEDEGDEDDVDAFDVGDGDGDDEF